MSKKKYLENSTPLTEKNDGKPRREERHLLYYPVHHIWKKVKLY